MKKVTTDNTMAEIVEAYNELADTPIKKFSTKAAGVARVEELQRGVVEEEEISAPSNEDFTSKTLKILEKAGALFNPVEVDIALPNGDMIPDKKAIVKDHDGSYVSTVGVGYNLTPNRDAFTYFCNTIKAAGVDTSGIEITPFVTDSKVYVNFEFPSIKVTVRDGDDINFMITARNSYDGSSRFSIQMGGFRLLCSNGMGLGSFTQIFSKKHMSGFELEDMETYIKAGIESFKQAGTEWEQMLRIKVNDEDALTVLKMTCEKTSSQSYEEIKEGRDSVLKSAIQLYETYKSEMGANKFALLNTVTHITTHVESISGNIVGLKIYKDKIRDKVLSSPIMRYSYAS